MNALIAKFATLPAAADAEAKTIDELRARVRELEAQVRAKPAPPAAAPVDRSAIEQAVREAKAESMKVVPGLVDGILAAAEKGVAAAVTAALGEAFKTARGLALPPSAAPAQPHPPDRVPTRAAKPAAAPPRLTTPAPAPPPSRSRVLGVTGPEQRIVDALLWWERVGENSPNLPALAFRASYSPKTSGFLKARGLCQGRGLLAYEPNSRTRLTEVGRATANPIEGDLKTQVLKLLKGPETRLLTALLANRTGLDDDRLAELSGYSPNTSGYLKARGHLCSLGLAVRRQPGWTEPAPFLFANT